MDGIKRFFYKMENKLVIESIRNGLIMVLPILLLGTFALILKSLPLDVYQNFIITWLDGALYDIFQMIYNATFGLLSIYITFSISTYYVRHRKFRESYVFGGAITSTVCFFVLSGVGPENMTTDYWGVRGMFTAILSAVVISQFYSYLVSHLKLPIRLYADGINMDFNDAIFLTFPVTITIAVVAVMNYTICTVFNVTSFHALYIEVANSLFDILGRNFLGGFVYVALSSILWFFGIHGSDVLEGVMQSLFVPASVENACQYVSGGKPAEIFTRQFFELFILIGGCGASLALILAILIFSKRKVNRSLAKLAIFPGIFNINEILVFGLPVIYNPVMLIPFILTPIVLFLVTYIAFSTGLVPLAVAEVNWTTPIIFSGYLATKSIAGSILQLLNLGIAILIYLPFIRIYDSIKDEESRPRIDELTGLLKDSESNNENITLTSLPGAAGSIAKSLSAELKEAILKKEIEMYYQPQYNYDGECVGAEALLRYKHPVYGMLYPPLVIKLAEEIGILYRLEKIVFEQVVEDMKQLEIKISVNVTVTTLEEKDFVDFLKNLKERYNIPEGKLCIEITEQMTMSSDREISEKLNIIRELGFLLAIDDFAMGHTSVRYLQTNRFDIVKLDGVIVRDMIANPRSREIISSIIYLSESLHFKVIAEFVENEEQIEELRRIGCHYYQGYYFGKADKLAKLLQQL